MTVVMLESSRNRLARHGSEGGLGTGSYGGGNGRRSRFTRSATSSGCPVLTARSRT